MLQIVQVLQQVIRGWKNDAESLDLWIEGEFIRFYNCDDIKRMFCLALSIKFIVLFLCVNLAICKLWFIYE